MVDSGIKTDPEALKLFTDGMSKKKSAKYDFLIFKLGKKEGSKTEMVIIEELADIGSCEEKYKDVDLKGVPASWYGFQERMGGEKEARYGIAYCDFKTKDNRDTDKLVFIYWNPDTGKLGDKMKYSSTKLSFIKKLNTAMSEVQASDAQDITYREVVTSISKGDCKF